MDVFEQIKRRAERLKIACGEGESFARLTTIGTGGDIRLTLRPDSVKKLYKILLYLQRKHVPTVLVGRGSNILAADEPYEGVAVVTTQVNGLYIRGRRLYADCGASAPAAAAALADRGLTGGEFLACLPATIGGAVVGNAGCFGQDVSGVFVRARVLRSGKVRTYRRRDCAFAKRYSVFREGGGVVLSVTLRFERSSSEQVRENIARMRRVKAQTQPLGARSAGCVLYHDRVAVSALLDRCGLKGCRIGGAEVSAKHAGFVINIDKATSLDIYLLVRRMRDALWQKYGIRAKNELQEINFHRNYDIFTECKGLDTEERT